MTLRILKVRVSGLKNSQGAWGTFVAEQELQTRTVKDMVEILITEGMTVYFMKNEGDWRSDKHADVSARDLERDDAR